MLTVLCQSLEFSDELTDFTRGFSETEAWYNDILPAEKQRLLEAVRDDRTEQTQASITTWAGAHQTIHSVAGTLGTNLLVQDAVKTALQEGERLGLGDHDLAALVEVFAKDRTS